MFSKLLIWFIVFFLPSQLGLHFWPSFSRAAGIRLDYLSPTLYFVDLLLLILVISTVRPLFHYLKQYISLVFFITLFIVFNTVFAVSPLNTLFWWARSLFYLLVYLSFRLRSVNWSQIEKPLFISSCFIVLLALFQTLHQSSLNGPFYWFGERAFTQQTPGLARVNLYGFDFVRPPSIFSHPNSFAGYLVIVFFLFRHYRRFWYSLIPFLGIILSLSKNALAATFFLLVGFSPSIFIILSISFSIFQFILPLIPSSWQSLSDRSFYFTYFPSILKKHLIFGTGLGGFIPALSAVLPGSFLTPAKLQPIHNLYMLFLSELGLLGLAPFLFTLKNKTLNQLKKNCGLFTLLGLVLFLGSLDHYFWTLPQNKLITLLALVLVL